MIPTPDYLKDVANFSKLTLSLKTIIPVKNRRHFSLGIHFCNLDGLLHTAGNMAVDLAEKGNTDFEFVLFQPFSFSLLQGGFALTKETRKSLIKRVNNGIVKKSEIVANILKRFGHNVTLEVKSPETIVDTQSIETSLKFNLEE